MATHIALLRAVNVGGRNRVGMSDLRAMLEALDFEDVRTLLQSGNVVFRGGRGASTAIERKLEHESRERLGLAVDYVVRTADEWQRAIDENPFAKAARSDPAHLLVLFMKDELEPSRVKELEAAIRGPEIVRARGKHLYAVYPEGVGQSKLTIALIEKKLATRGTGRNWNTVLKLAALSRE